MVGARAGLFVAALVLVANASAKQETLKICVVGNPKLKQGRTTKFCELLGKSKRTPVSCSYGADRLECLTAVSRRRADFGVFEPEDLYFSTLRDESSLLVVSELRALKNKPYEYGTVVLVRKDVNVTCLADLRGKRLCHPGTGEGSRWNNLFSQYFEERIAPADCDEGLSVMEDRIKTTSEFFGSACKAGPWSPIPSEDARLKKKYWNLCALCDSGDCANDEKYRGSGGSITCLKDGVGDVLWARYEDVKIHLKFLNNDSSGQSSDYYYLCDDGTLMMMSAEEPCYWAAKPWQIIVANTKSATDVQKVMNAVKQEEHSDWGENLLHVIELYLEYVHTLIVARTPEDYLRSVPGYLSASEMAESNCKPRRSVKLCVTSALEKEKCIWMSKAASAVALQPSLDCVQKSNVSACLQSVAEKKADVVAASPDYLYDAVTKYNLKPFLVEKGSGTDGSYLTSVLVKKKSEVKTPSDMKGKTVCLSRKNGIGWKSILSGLHRLSLVESECEGGRFFKEFFKEVCVWEKGEENEWPLCCPTAIRNSNVERGLLACLYEDGCDVAVLDFGAFKRNPGKESSTSIKGFEFREICQTEKTSECFWSWSHANYLMTNSDGSEMLEPLNFFYRLGRTFGKNSSESSAMMKIFEPFNGISNVLFRDTSTSFALINTENCPRSYLETVNRMKICSNSSTRTPVVGFMLLVISLSRNFNSIVRLIA